MANLKKLLMSGLATTAALGVLFASDAAVAQAAEDGNPDSETTDPSNNDSSDQDGSQTEPIEGNESEETGTLNSEKDRISTLIKENADKLEDSAALLQEVSEAETEAELSAIEKRVNAAIAGATDEDTDKPGEGEEEIKSPEKAREELAATVSDIEENYPLIDVTEAKAILDDKKATLFDLVNTNDKLQENIENYDELVLDSAKADL